MASRARPATEITAAAHVGTRAGVVDLPPNRAALGPGGGAVRAGGHAGEEPVAKRHEVLGLLVLSIATLLGLALASYDARGGAGRDWCGPTGAMVAESLVAFLGTASVLLPWSLLVLAVRLFRRTVRPLQFFRALGTAGIIATIATAMHLGFGERPMLGHLAPGGLLGMTIGELLRGLFGTAGAHVVVLTVLLVALVVRTRLSVVSMATQARSVGLRSSRAARDGVVTVARAWRQARDEEKRARAEALESEAPRIVAPEDRTASALAGVFAHAHEDGARAFEAEDGAAGAGSDAPSAGRAHGGGGDDEESESPDAAVAALLGGVAAVSPARVAGAAVHPASPAPGGGGAEVQPAGARTRRGRKSSAAVQAAAPAVEEAAPLDETPPPAVVVAGAMPAPAPAAPAPRVRARRGRVQATPPATAADDAAMHHAHGAAHDEAAEDDDDEEEEQPAPMPLSTRARRAAPPAARPEPESESESEPEPDLDEPDEDDDEPEDASALEIVSHDEEIEAAKQAAPVPDDAPRAAARSTPPAAAPRPARPMQLPSSELLTAAPTNGVQFDEAQLRAAADRLLKTLKDYTIDGRVVEIHPGPVVTTYEFVPAAGTKLSKIARLSDDIAMSLEANKVRIVAPIPGKGRVGFEIPNAKRTTVYFRELIETPAFQQLGGALPVALGKDVVGAPFFADLSAMPHLIVAGATGAGKSVGLNVMLTSLLYKRGPEDVRLLMIDPKMVELAVYDNIPHMLLPVVTDMKKASLALRWVVDEMERRYTLFAQTGSRNITTYNERVAKALAEGKTLKGLSGPVRTKVTGTTMEIAPPPVGEDGAPAPPASPDEPRPTRLPYILVVVDEFADLMMVAGKEVEAAVARLAQKARAAGIHVILATQRPSVDVITGVIKANFPSRIAFKVSQKVDSRTILDQQGAEHLLGRGDMLILPPGSSDLRRVHCAFVSEDEVQAVTDHWRNQGTPTYDEDILRPRDEDEEGGGDEPEIKVPMDKYEKAVALVLSSRRCSVSWVQRQLAIGYNVAARMVEKMERDGIVSAPRGPGKDREVLG